MMEQKRNVPSLGFPDEFWDDEGDLFCRPRPDLVAAILGDSTLWSVEINDYSPIFFERELAQKERGLVHAEEIRRRGPLFGRMYLSWLRQLGPYYVDNVDGALHALAIIQHFLSSNPPQQEISHGET